MPTSSRSVTSCTPPVRSRLPSQPRDWPISRPARRPHSGYCDLRDPKNLIRHIRIFLPGGGSGSRCPRPPGSPRRRSRPREGAIAGQTACLTCNCSFSMKTVATESPFGAFVAVTLFDWLGAPIARTSSWHVRRIERCARVASSAAKQPWRTSECALTMAVGVQGPPRPRAPRRMRLRTVSVYFEPGAPGGAQ